MWADMQTCRVQWECAPPVACCLPGCCTASQVARTHAGSFPSAALHPSVRAQVSHVAHCMVADAERWHAERKAAGGGGAGAAGAEPAVKLFDMKAIQNFT